MLKEVSNTIFDVFFAIFITNNFVIFVWRVIWDTQDLYLKNNPYFNSIISLLIAYILIFFVKCIQINEISSSFQHKYLATTVPDQSDSDAPKIKAKLKIKFLILVISVANINHWRCLWNYTLHYTNHSLNGIFTLAIIALLMMGSMKRVGCLVSSPFQIGKDSYDAAYGIQPASANHNYYLSLKNELASSLPPNNWQILLSFLIEFIADICTIHSWRSLWYFLDLYLCVDNRHNSALASLAIGVCIYLVVHVINKPLNRYISKSNDQASTKDNLTNRVIKTLLLYTLFGICFVGTVCTWRGVWELQLVYCYPQLVESKLLNQNLLNVFYFSVSILVLWIMGMVASLQSRSSAEDSYFWVEGNFILQSELFENYCQDLKTCFSKNKFKNDFESSDYFISVSLSDTMMKTTTEMIP